MMDFFQSIRGRGTFRQSVESFEDHTDRVPVLNRLFQPTTPSTTSVRADVFNPKDTHTLVTKLRRRDATAVRCYAVAG